MANPKKFLDADGLTYFAQLLNNYPDNTILAAVIDAIQDALDTKADSADIPSATTVSQTLTSGTAIATINGTTIYAPSYTDADGVSY